MKPELQQEKVNSLEAVKGILEKAREKLEKSGKYPIAIVPVKDRDVAEKENNEIIRRCLEELLGLKDGFEKVFETERGSTYFLLKSGEVVRIKKKDEYHPNSWQIPPMRKNIFFVGAEEVQKIVSEYKYILSGKTIEVVPCDIGAHPVDLSMFDDDAVLVYDEVVGGSVHFKGYKYSDGDFSDNVSGIHCGNKITRIIK